MAFRRLASSTTLYELRVPVDEFLNEPWAGDPVDLDALARDPFHAILHLPCMRTPPSADQYLGRCETAHCRACSMEERSESRRGQSIFSPPGPSFSQVLFAARQRAKHRTPTLHRAADDGRAKWASISRHWPAAWCGRSTSFLRSPERNVAFGAKNIGVEIGNPLPAVRRDVEIAKGRLNVWRHAVPVELRIFVDDIGGAVVAELAVEAGFFELVIERVGLADVMRIAELSDQVGGSQQRGLLVEVFHLRGHAAREA